MKRILGYGTASLALLACAVVVFFYAVKPSSAEPSTIKVNMSPERVARGRYIYTLADCDGCHSERDFTRFAGPVVETGRGRGSVFPKELGMPGTIVAPNITPDRETGIGAWTDGEKIRAIREGIGRDGRPLFPMMAYEAFRSMSDEDVESLVAYLNTLAPVRHFVPRTVVDFPVSMFSRIAPKPAGSVPPPDRRDPVKYGEYLVTIAGCAGCHTARDGGERLAGGERFAFPGATVVSANITPDAATGIGSWTEEVFVNRFARYRPYLQTGSPKAAPEAFTIMPWLTLAQAADSDLRAIYAYLRAQPAISNQVETHPGVLRAAAPAGRTPGSPAGPANYVPSQK